MSVEFDLSDLSRLTAQLADVPTGSEKNFRSAAEVTSRRVKDAWNGKLYSEGHAARTGRAITYDITVARDAVTADIGAVRGSGRQAGVVRLLENGSIHNGAHGYGAAALHENEDDFQHGVQLAIDAALKQAGL